MRSHYNKKEDNLDKSVFSTAKVERKPIQPVACFVWVWDKDKRVDASLCDETYSCLDAKIHQYLDYAERMSGHIRMANITLKRP